MSVALCLLSLYFIKSRLILLFKNTALNGAMDLLKLSVDTARFVPDLICIIKTDGYKFTPAKLPNTVISHYHIWQFKL